MSILGVLFPLYTSFLFSLVIPAAADNGIVLEAVKGPERGHGKMTHSRSAGISGSSRAEHHSQLSRNVSDGQIVEKSRSPTDKDSVYSSDSIGSLDQSEMSDLDQGRTRGSSPSTDLPASDSPVSDAYTHFTVLGWLCSLLVSVCYVPGYIGKGKSRYPSRCRGQLWVVLDALIQLFHSSVL